MSRQGKTIGLIQDLYKRALKHGFASLRRDGKEIYHINHEPYNGVISLFHCGTRTLMYDTTQRKILYSYGWSASDRDSLNTLLDCLEHDNNQYFRLSGGEFILEGPEPEPVVPEISQREQLVSLSEEINASNLRTGNIFERGTKMWFLFKIGYALESCSDEDIQNEGLVKKYQDLFEQIKNIA